MSPEQAEGAPVDPSSDIYSLGIVAYQCAAGRLPFTAETPMALAVAQVREEPPPLPAGIPAPVRDLIMRMIAKDPLERPATARDVADAASGMLAELPADGPQLADVAAWVAAGTGEPLSDAEWRGTTMVQPTVRSGRLSSRRSRGLVAAALICLAGGTAAALTAAVLMLPGSGKPATTHIRTGPITLVPTPTARPVTHHSSSTTPSPVAATVGPTRTPQPGRASPQVSQQPVIQAAPPNPPPISSAPPSPPPSTSAPPSSPPSSP
jgi:serine/threonine-protein kinase